MTRTVSSITCWEGELGWCAFALTHRGLAALTFGHADPSRAYDQLRQLLERHHFELDPWAPAPGMSAFQASLQTRLDAFMSGQKEEFEEVALDLPGLTPFQMAVVQACREVPWGERCTYGELARRVGRPRAARAVGAVMAQNRVPLVVPCHRVVGSSGKLVGFSAPQGLTMKQRLLAAEQVDRDGLAEQESRQLTLA